MTKMTGVVLASALWLGSAPVWAAYLPTPEQRSKLEQLLTDYGKYFGAGRMLQAGKSRRQAGVVAYWYKFGDDTIRWRLEEWVPLPRGLFHLRIWDFQEDRATINEDIVDGGILREIRFAEPIPMDGKEAIGLSSLTLKILTEADPADYDQEPLPVINPHALNL